MIGIFIIVAVASAVVAQGSGVATVAIVNAVISFIALGIMANFRDDPDKAPSAAIFIAMITTILAVIFFIVGLAA